MAHIRPLTPTCLDGGEEPVEWRPAQCALVLVLLDIEEMDVLGEVSGDALDTGIEQVNGGKEDRVQPATAFTRQYLSLRVDFLPLVKVELGARVRQQLVKFLIAPAGVVVARTAAEELFHAGSGLALAPPRQVERHFLPIVGVVCIGRHLVDLDPGCRPRPPVP